MLRHSEAAFAMVMLIPPIRLSAQYDEKYNVILGAKE